MKLRHLVADTVPKTPKITASCPAPGSRNDLEGLWLAATLADELSITSGPASTKHIALGLLDQPEGLAARAIQALGVTPEAARQALVAALPPATADELPAGRAPFTPRARKVLELALREALNLGHNYIGTEHILLGVLTEGDGIGGKTLADLGVTRERVREWLIPVLEQLAGQKRQES